MAAIILVAINSVPIFAASSRVFANHIMAETIQDQVQTAIVDIMTTAEAAAIAIAIDKSSTHPCLTLYSTEAILYYPHAESSIVFQQHIHT